jgi:oligopeptidase B
MDAPLQTNTGPGADAAPPAPAPPPAPAEPHAVTEHGQVRVDEYRWLQRLDDPRVIEYLVANNIHAEACLQHTLPLQEQLLAEFLALLPPDEGPAAVRQDGYWYRTRYAAGAEYPCFVRHAGSPAAPEEVLLDGNALATGHACFLLEGIQVSPHHDRLLFAVDTSGSRQFTLRIKDVARGGMLADRIPNADCFAAWAQDNRTLFYTRLHPVTLRPYQVCRHVLGTDAALDPVLYEEADDAFRCLLTPSRSRRFIFLTCFSSDTEEVRFLRADLPESAFTVFCPRTPGHEYELDDDGQRFLVRTNLGAPDFRVCEADIGTPPPAAWRDLLPATDGVLVEKVAAFRDWLAVVEFHAGRQRLRILDRRSGEAHQVPFPDPVYHVWLDATPDTDSGVVRVGYSSLVTPPSYYDYDMAQRTLTLLEREAIPGYRAEHHVTEQLWAPARDGSRIPITLVARRDTRQQGPAPLLLFAYGAYGTNMPPYFDPARLSLLDRGFAYAMAHVRGGSELGCAWYHAGRLLQKMNSVTDFMDAAEFLIAAGIGRRGRLYAESLSAGGLLLGTAMNLRPDLFHGIVAHVPFVDVLSTMADPLSPLTSSEYEEWGDPRRVEDWTYMRAYSPYDNIAPRPYPHLLATASLHDSQVQCWEPAKWVARLRTCNTGGSRILLRTNLEAGHAGASGRIQRLRDTAFACAFLLDLAGLAGSAARQEPPPTSAP